MQRSCLDSAQVASMYVHLHMLATTALARAAHSYAPAEDTRSWLAAGQRASQPCFIPTTPTHRQALLSTSHAPCSAINTCRLLQQHTHERVALHLDVEPIPNAATFSHQFLTVRLAVACSPPVLRSIHFTRTSGSGNASETLVSALLAHTALDGVWKLRGCEGLGHFWATCVQAPGDWRSLKSLNLSSCGLGVLPAAVGQLGGLRVLRLNHNKLVSLTPEVSSECLAAGQWQEGGQRASRGRSQNSIHTDWTAPAVQDNAQQAVQQTAAIACWWQGAQLMLLTPYSNSRLSGYVSGCAYQEASSGWLVGRMRCKAHQQQHIKCMLQYRCAAKLHHLSLYSAEYKV